MRSISIGAEESESLVRPAKKLIELQAVRLVRHMIYLLRMDNTLDFGKWEQAREDCLVTEIMLGTRQEQHTSITLHQGEIGAHGHADGQLKCATKNLLEENTALL